MYLSLTNRPIKIIDEREYYIMKNFEEAKKRNFKRLEQFVPVVARVHGEHHPEFHDVHKIFDEINAKVKKAICYQRLIKHITLNRQKNELEE